MATSTTQELCDLLVEVEEAIRRIEGDQFANAEGALMQAQLLLRDAILVEHAPSAIRGWRSAVAGSA